MLKRFFSRTLILDIWIFDYLERKERKKFVGYLERKKKQTKFSVKKLIFLPSVYKIKLRKKIHSITNPIKTNYLL